MYINESICNMHSPYCLSKLHVLFAVKDFNLHHLTTVNLNIFRYIRYRIRAIYFTVSLSIIVSVGTDFFRILKLQH